MENIELYSYWRSSCSWGSEPNLKPLEINHVTFSNHVTYCKFKCA